MARKPRRKFRRYLKGQISEEVATGALASRAVKVTAVSDTVTEKAFLSSVKATWAIRGRPLGANEGPIEVGLAHSDYTAAEVEEWIENVSSWEAHDLIGQEIAKRKIRRVGIFRGSTGANIAQVLNDGKPITTKCGWMLGTSQTVKIWQYNLGTADLQAGADLEVEGHANLWPA